MLTLPLLLLVPMPGLLLPPILPRPVYKLIFSTPALISSPTLPKFQFSTTRVTSYPETESTVTGTRVPTGVTIPTIVDEALNVLGAEVVVFLPYP